MYLSLFMADDQILIANKERNLHLAAYQPQEISRDFNLEISWAKTTVMGFKGKETVRSKVAV